ncbi:MAG: hypothetical protein WCK37_02000 [Candidatus Falkowbacteria bacterium]
MKIRGIEFTNCFLASGSLNFFGDGWPYDVLYKIFVPGFRRINRTTFVAKTTTLNYRAGNMPLNKNLQPKEFKPKCIKIYPFKGAVLNAVGLSGPGAKALFDDGRWQKIDRPFFISFMAVGNTKEERLQETKDFVALLKYYLPGFKTKIGLQINISCPNTKHHTADLAGEALEVLRIASDLKIPLDLKANALIGTETVREIEASGLCDILTISNTIPWGTPDVGIDWKKFSKTGESPLAEFGGGGLSGSDIFPLVLYKIQNLRFEGIKMPIKASGGISSPKKVRMIKKAGADFFEIGYVLMIRPLRVWWILRQAEKIKNLEIK